MSKKQSIAVSLLQRTCIWYSGISLFILAINLLIDSQMDGVEPLNLLLIFPFAFCLALANTVRRTNKLSTATRVILHPLCVLGGFFLCVYMTSNRNPLVLAVAAAIYGIAALIMWLRARAQKRKANRNTPYISQFGKKS